MAKLKHAVLVQIKELTVENGKLFMMKMAGIPIRAYLTLVEASRVANYMREIVDAIIAQNTEKDAVQIQSIRTKDEGTIYLLTIAVLPLRTFIDGYEAKIIGDFMQTVVVAILANK